MSTRSKLGASILIVVAVAVAAIFRGGALDTRSYEFETRDQARDLILKGWIPSFTPPSATKIHIRYSTDDSETWGKFDLARSDAVTLERELAAQRTEPSSLPDPGISWWISARVSAPSNSWFAIDEPRHGSRVILVVDTNAATAFFWRRPM